MLKFKELRDFVIRDLVARTLGLFILTLSPIAIFAEFIERYTEGVFDLGEFVSDIKDLYNETFALILKGDY